MFCSNIKLLFAVHTSPVLHCLCGRVHSESIGGWWFVEHFIGPVFDIGDMFSAFFYIYFLLIIFQTLLRCAFVCCAHVIYSKNKRVTTISSKWTVIKIKFDLRHCHIYAVFLETPQDKYQRRHNTKHEKKRWIIRWISSHINIVKTVYEVVPSHILKSLYPSRLDAVYRTAAS